MELIKAIEERRSIRRFSDTDVPDDDILKIVRAAGLAPSAGNQQMWHFIVVKNKALINEMREAVRTVIDEMLTWPESVGHEEAVNKLYRVALFFADAPVTIAALSKEYDNTIDREILPKRGISTEEIYQLRGDPSRQSLGAAIQNLLLVAQSLGYGTCWMVGPLYAKPALEKILNVKDPWSLAAIIPLGVPARIPPRKPIEEIYSIIR